MVNSAGKMKKGNPLLLLSLTHPFLSLFSTNFCLLVWGSPQTPRAGRNNPQAVISIDDRTMRDSFEKKMSISISSKVIHSKQRTWQTQCTLLHVISLGRGGVEGSNQSTGFNLEYKSLKQLLMFHSMVSGSYRWKVFFFLIYPIQFIFTIFKMRNMWLYSVQR